MPSQKSTAVPFRGPRVNLKPSAAVAEPGLSGLGPVPARPDTDAALSDLRAAAEQAGLRGQPVSALRPIIRKAVASGLDRAEATCEAEEAFLRGDRRRLGEEQRDLPLGPRTVQANEVEPARPRLWSTGRSGRGPCRRSRGRSSGCSWIPAATSGR